jgi:hypothetical protein
MSGHHSKNKGKRGERQFAILLREEGWADARRGQQFQGSPESADVVATDGNGNELPFHFEVKVGGHPRLSAALEQAARDAGEYKIPVAATRQDRREFLVTLTAKDFCALLRCCDLDDLRTEIAEGGP